MMTTDDILRAWFRPVRPYIRLGVLLFIPVAATLDGMLRIDPATGAPEMGLGRGLLIIAGALIAGLDSLYQRSPKRRAFPAVTFPPVPPPLPIPAPAPTASVEDLPRSREEVIERLDRLKARMATLAAEIEELDRDIPREPPAPTEDL